MVAVRFASIAILTVLCVSVSGQGFTGIPQCAQTCAVNAIPKDCNGDPKCICSATSFLEGIGCCVLRACSREDVEKTTQFAQEFCKRAEVTNLPTPTCPDSASSNSTAATSSMATSSASSSATGAGAAAASSTGSANNLMAHGMGVLGAAVVGAVALM